jgi:1,4-alpha-glucan branching enzyme
MLYELRSAGHILPLTVAISPVLLEQLADPLINKHLVLWLSEWRGRVHRDLARFEALDYGHGVYLARFYIDWLDHIEHNFVERFGRNLVAATRGLLRKTAEVLLSPATFAYLPQLTAVELRAQLEVGAMTVLRHFGQRPHGLWLPGGGFHPGLKPIAQELGLSYVVGLPGDESSYTRTTGLPIIHPDGTLLQHVVASGFGYPGDGVYREFYRHHPQSGIAYWRITGLDVPQHAKDVYDPYLAFNRVEEHADHFVQVIRERLAARAYHRPDATPTLVIAFDVELFGHWWFEGVRWLQGVLSRLLTSDDLQLVTLNNLRSGLPEYELESQPAHPLFDAPISAVLRSRTAEAAQDLLRAVQANPTAEGQVEQLLGQAVRELLLVQSSDWPTLIATGMAQEYAQRRFDEHIMRLQRLLAFVPNPAQTIEAKIDLREIAELDNPFPFINYRIFSDETT